MKRFVILAIISTFLVSCGQESTLWPVKSIESASVGPATSELFSYEFSGPGCTTGMQSAQTFDEICQTLTDDNLNQGCAENKREDLFYSAECVGSFI